MKIKVAEPFRLVHAGAVYNPGDTADIDDTTGHEWITQGWATETKPASKAAPPKATPRKAKPG